MKTFYKCNFQSRMIESEPMKQKCQHYKATDIADAMMQHERCTAIFKTNHPEYECKLITMSRETNKQTIKELEIDW